MRFTLTMDRCAFARCDGLPGLRRTLTLTGFLLTIVCAAAPLDVPTIRIGVENNSPPLSYTEADGVPQGFTPELLHEMERTGLVKFEVIAESWLFISTEFEAGRLDALANVIRTEARRATMEFSIAHASLHGLIYTRPGDPLITHTAQFAGKTMATLKGTMSHLNAVNHQGWGATIVADGDWNKVLLSVKNGQCDFALLSRRLMFEQPDEMGLHREFVEDVIHHFHMVVHPGNRDNLEAINEALAIIRQNGTFDRLHAKWIGPIEPHPIRWNDLRPYFWWACLAVTVVLSLVTWLVRGNRRLALQAQALRTNETMLGNVAQIAMIGGWELDVRAKRVVWSAETCRLHGVEPGTVPTLDEAIDFYVPASRPVIEAAVVAAMEKGEEFDLELEIIAKTGRRLWVRSQGKALWEDGQVVRLVGSLQDISAQRIQQYQMRLQSMVAENLAEGVILSREDGTIIYTNAQFDILFGYERGELTGQNASRLIDRSGIDADRLQQEIEGAMSQENGHWQGEGRNRRKDGTRFWCFATIRWFDHPDHGRICLGVHLDITEHKQAEMDLRMSEERLRLSTELAHVAVWEYDFAANAMSRSRNHDSLYGLPWQEKWDLVTFAAATHPDDRSLSNATIMKSVAPGGPDNYEFDFRVIYPDQSVHWLMVTGRVASRNPDGTAAIVRGCLMDITHRKKLEIERDQLLAKADASRRTLLSVIEDQTKLEAELRVSEERFRGAVLHSPFPILLHAEDGAIIQASDSWCEITGYTRDELKTIADWTERAYGERKEPVLVEIESLYGLSGSKAEGDFAIRTKDGSIRVWDFHSAPLGRLPDGRRLVISMAMDVTERRRAEAELNRNREKLEAAFSSMTDAIFISDTEGNFIEFNEAFATFHRFKNKRECASKLSDYPQFLEVFMADGSPAPNDMWAVPRALRGETVTNAEYALRRKDTGETWIGSYSFAPVHDDEGNIVGTVVVARDITELKRNSEKLKDSLRQKEALLKEVHHRVKNNLQVISSLLRLEAARRTAAGAKEVLTDMQGRIRSMALLHETLYRTGNFARVDLGGYLRELATQLFRAQNAAPQRVQLELQLDGVMIEIDQAIPCGLIVNELLTNALKHGFPDQKTGRVRVHLSQTADQSVNLQINDTGVGLPAGLDPARLDSLGLRLVSDLTRQLLGKLTIGAGAQFDISFKPRLHAGTASNPVSYPDS